MQIRLTRTYRGFDTGGQPIAAGEYSSGDDKLLGVEAEYLVLIGVAVDVSDQQSVLQKTKPVSPSKPAKKTKDKK